MRRIFGWLALPVVLLWALAAAPAFAEPTFPTRGTDPVVDEAHMLSAQTHQALADKLTALERSTGRQVVVVTLPSLQGYEIADYGYQLGRTWGIGEKDKNTGVLFIVAPTEHKTRIEVGYGLEGTLTDALSSIILQRTVLPKFKAGDMEGGVVAGTDAIIEQLSLPDDQAKAKVAAASSASHSRGRGDVSPVAGIFILIFIFFMISSLFGRRGRGGGLGGALPWIILGSALGGRRDGGGGWGGGGGGGGGFSGGGGSFGGGGSSGSW
jgi:uncharacterized protein